MATQIRPELSNKNKYRISKHRYYELIHFCRQYQDYINEKERLYDTYVRPVIHKEVSKEAFEINITEDWGIKLAYLDDKIRMIERCAAKAGDDLGSYILMAVTNGLTYETMLTRYQIPCCRNTFYDKYRYFFWLLSEARG